MGMLELGAIDLDAGAGVAEERLGNCFDHAGLAGAGRSQEKQVAYGTARSVESGEKHLIDFRDLFDGLVLANDFAAQGALEVTGVVAAAARIQHSCKVRSHRIGPLFSFWKLNVFCEAAHFCQLRGKLHFLACPFLCKPLAILPKCLNPSLLIVLDAASPLRARGAALPTVSPRAILCRLREVSLNHPPLIRPCPVGTTGLAPRNWHLRLLSGHNETASFLEKILVSILDGQTFDN